MGNKKNNKKRLVCCLTAAALMSGSFMNGKTAEAYTRTYFPSRYKG